MSREEHGRNRSSRREEALFKQSEPRYLGCYRRIKFSVRKSFRHRHSLEHGLGFVDGFLKFALGRRIVDPAAPGLHVSLAVLEQRGADGDAGVEIAVERKITDAAAIRSAGGLFELGNNLHLADFRDRKKTR